MSGGKKFIFNRVIDKNFPCETYYSNGLFTLGNDITKEAENHGCRVVYQRIPGMYNAKLVSDDDYSDYEVDTFDYSRAVSSIKAWIARNEERY